MYDLIVIGAGSGGLTAVKFANQLGANVALVEKDRIGGDCTWTGCVPSKALLHVAKTIQAARQARHFGNQPTTIEVDMPRVKAAVQQAVQNVYNRENPEKIRADGIDIYMGDAKFLHANQIKVGKQILESKKFILTTGARPFVPPIKGIEEVPYLTYQTFFDNETLPQQLLVLGAGPIGVETSQAYGRLGARVTLVDVGFFPREESEVSQVMAPVFERDGIQFVPGLATAVTSRQGQFLLTVSDKSNQKDLLLKGDMLLLATGRKPNVIGLDLEKAGVVYSEEGIRVNDRLQTTATNIYAAGDCTGSLQFTHFAGWQGYKAARNALLPGDSSGYSDIVPRVTFTDPEVAQVGLTEAAAQVQFGDKFRVLKQSLIQEDRAQTDGAIEGFVKIMHHDDGRILGATIVAPRAGEMISEITLAMQNDLTLENIAHTIHPYPTFTTGLQVLASEQAMADFQQSALGKLMHWFVTR